MRALSIHVHDRGRRDGFSLIEMIGVLSVIAILAAMAGPAMIKRIDAAARTAERESLAAMADGLVQSSLRNRQIPAAADFPLSIASYLEYNTAKITTTPRGFQRRFVVDPALNINGGGLPYVQGANGSANLPVNGRVMILSTIARALPVKNYSAAEFATLWNAAEGIVPSALSTWGGRGEDLMVQRVELRPLFSKVLLVNVDPVNVGRYSVDTNSMTSLAGLSQLSMYVMNGTVVNFFRADSKVDSREIIRNDVSFVYQNNRWGRRLGAADDVLEEFGNWVHEFLKPPAPTDPEFAATQQAVVNEFYSFLWGYGVWAFGDATVNPPVPPFAGQNGSGTPNYPSYSVAYDAQVKLDNFTGNLIK